MPTGNSRRRVTVSGLHWIAQVTGHFGRSDNRAGNAVRVADGQYNGAEMFSLGGNDEPRPYRRDGGKQ